METIEQILLKQVRFQLETMLYNMNRIDTSKMSKEKLEDWFKRSIAGIESIKEYIEVNSK